MIKKIILQVTCYCLLVTGLIGCGYTTRSLISNKFKTIYIPIFSNKIDISDETKASRNYQVYRPLLETDITKAVIDRFTLDGNLRMAKEQDADLILRGSLIDFRRDVLRYATDETPEEYRISIFVEVNLWDKTEDKLLWEDKNVVGDTSYFLSGPNVKSEDAAISDALDDLARRVVEQLVEEW